MFSELQVELSLSNAADRLSWSDATLTVTAGFRHARLNFTCQPNSDRLRCSHSQSINLYNKIIPGTLPPITNPKLHQRVHACMPEMQITLHNRTALIYLISGYGPVFRAKIDRDHT